MKLITTLVFFITILTASAVTAQDCNHNRNYHRPQQRVYYYPQTQWYFSGPNLSIYGARVSPNRRYVRFGINMNFNSYQGYQNYNYNPYPYYGPYFR